MNEAYKKLSEMEIPERFRLKAVAIPAASSTVTTLLNDRYGMHAARIRKEALTYLENGKKCLKKADEIRTLNPEKAEKYYLDAENYFFLASAEGRNSSRGKKNLFEEGSFRKGDAFILLDNVSSFEANSKKDSRDLIVDEGSYLGFKLDRDYKILGSLVWVSTAQTRKKFTMILAWILTASGPCRNS